MRPYGTLAPASRAWPGMACKPRAYGAVADAWDPSGGHKRARISRDRGLHRQRARARRLSRDEICEQLVEHVEETP